MANNDLLAIGENVVALAPDNIIKHREGNVPLYESLKLLLICIHIMI